jgi:hypothetical protein
MKSIEQKYGEPPICFPSIEPQNEKLPIEMLTQIFFDLSLPDRKRASQVCKNWRVAIISLYLPEINKILGINESLRSLISSMNGERYEKVRKKIETLIAINLTQSDLSFRDLQMEKARIRDECAGYLKEIDEEELKLVDLSWPEESRGALADVIRVARLLQKLNSGPGRDFCNYYSISVEFADLKHLNHLKFAAEVANQIKDCHFKRAAHQTVFMALLDEKHFYSAFEEALLIAYNCADKSKDLDFLPEEFLNEGALDEAEKILKVKPELASESIQQEIAYAFFKQGEKKRAARCLGIEPTDANLEALKEKFRDLESFFASVVKFKEIFTYVKEVLNNEAFSQMRLTAVLIHPMEVFKRKDGKTLARYFDQAREVTQQYVNKAFLKVIKEDCDILDVAELCLSAGDLEACDELIQSNEEELLPQLKIEVEKLKLLLAEKLSTLASLAKPCSKEIEALIQKKAELDGANLLDAPFETTMRESLFKDAIDYAHSIPHPSIRAGALLEISSKLVFKGLKEQALQLIEEIPPELLNFKIGEWGGNSKYLREAALFVATQQCMYRKDFEGARMFAGRLQAIEEAESSEESKTDSSSESDPDD